MAKSSKLAGLAADLQRASTAPQPELDGPVRGRPGRVPTVAAEDRSYMLAGRFPEAWRGAMKMLMARPENVRREVRDVIAEALGILMTRAGIEVPPT